MSLENDLFTVLSSIPEMARSGPQAYAVSPVIFPQPAKYNPLWPAIRYTFVSGVPITDICGDGGDDSEDVRVQLDIVALTRSEVRTIRLKVRDLMQEFYPPATLDLEFDEYDIDTATYRWVMDYLIAPSSTIGSP